MNCYCFFIANFGIERGLREAKYRYIFTGVVEQSHHTALREITPPQFFYQRRIIVLLTGSRNFNAVCCARKNSPNFYDRDPYGMYTISVCFTYALYIMYMMYTCLIIHGTEHAEQISPVS